jgi:hypothetical protein
MPFSHQVERFFRVAHEVENAGAVAARSVGGVHVRARVWRLRASSLAQPLQTKPFLVQSEFPDVCPEPVLANDRGFFKTRNLR